MNIVYNNELISSVIKRKPILVAIGVSFIIVVVILLFLLLRKPEKTPVLPTVTPTPIPTIGTGVTIFPTPTPFISVIANPTIPTSPPTPVPQVGDIIVSGIAVNDFYKDAKRVLNNGDVLIRETEDYQIAYLKQYESFKITLLSPEFETARSKAEDAFIKALAIDEPNACRLTVEINTPEFVGGNYKGMVFPLSFCEHHEESDVHN